VAHNLSAAQSRLARFSCIVQARCSPRSSRATSPDASQAKSVPARRDSNRIDLIARMNRIHRAGFSTKTQRAARTARASDCSPGSRGGGESPALTVSCFVQRGHNTAKSRKSFDELHVTDWRRSRGDRGRASVRNETRGYGGVQSDGMAERHKSCKPASRWYEQKPPLQLN
jgi:hypothetical protein